MDAILTSGWAYFIHKNRLPCEKQMTICGEEIAGTLGTQIASKILMPTKRRFILFLIVLTLMLLIKRAVGQDCAVGTAWDGSPELDSESKLLLHMLSGVLAGSIGGFLAAWTRKRQGGGSFTGSDLIQLRLR